MRILVADCEFCEALFGFRAKAWLAPLLASTLLASLAASPAGALTNAPPEIRREVLALYDGSRELEADETLIHKLAEMPLNHLGYFVRFHDVRKPLPDAATLQRYAAVVTWFEAPLSAPRPYLEWAIRAGEQGTRFIVLGEIGGNPFSSDITLMNKFLSFLELKHLGQIVDLTFGSNVVYMDHAYIGFERPIDVVLPPYPVLARIGGNARALLQIEPADRSNYRRSTVGAISPLGAFIALGYIYYYDVDGHRLKWILNPFSFFKEALGNKYFPVPDVTTVSGRRIYFSHVDGNGWNNAVQIPGYRERGSIAAEVFEKELVAPFPNIPVTVSVTAGDLDARFGGTSVSAPVANRIFSYSNVEIGVHTYTYPLVWKIFEGPEGRSPRPGAARDAMAQGRRGLGAWLTGRDASAVRRATPASLSSRSYPQTPFALKTEVTDAVRFIEQYAPLDKRATIYTWSGDDRPFEAAIRATRAAGLRNLNGGDSRFNASYPSIAYISPISRTVGSERQIYAASNNENYSLDEAGEPNYAFSNLSETIRNTEKPRRLTPIDLYYSVHSAERSATLNSVRAYLKILGQGPYLALRSSEYAAMADSFFDVKLYQLKPLTWLVRSRGALQTLRLENAEELEIDYKKSMGVIGQSRIGSILYLALDPVVSEPVVALRRITEEPPAGPLLAEASWAVRSAIVRSCQLTFIAQGFGDGQFTWTGLAPGSYRVSAEQQNSTAWQHSANVGGNGVLKFTIPGRGDIATKFRVQCESENNLGG